MPMKLQIINKYSMPENTELYYAKAAVAMREHTLAWLGLYDGGEKFSLSFLSEQGIESVILNDIQGDVDAYHSPVLIALEDGRAGVIENGDTLYLYRSLTEPPEKKPIRNHGVFSGLDLIPRTQSMRAVGDGQRQYVIFAESISCQNPRYMAELFRDAAGDDFAWGDLIQLDFRQFPQNRFGSGFEINEPMDGKPPIIGGTMIKNGSIFAFAEGSDNASVNRYGMDYYSLVDIDRAGCVLRKIFEAADLKDLPGKHGVRGCFSSSREYLILTPVFKSGEWKGRPKLFDMGTEKLLNVDFPKSAKDFKIIDHYNGRFYLSDLKHKILVCGASD
jgi:hypothetical protein